MVYREHIQKAIDYIEKNLMNDMDLAICAKVSGYSKYHFLRVFKEATSLTPAGYIRKRRLTEIAKQLTENNDFISEVAFKYGFNSKENFIRAFRSEHNILPNEYRSAKNSLKLYSKITFEQASFEIIPSIEELDTFNITAYRCIEDYVPKFWNEYNCKKLSKKLSGGIECQDYGVSIINQGFQYYIGILTELAKGNTRDTVNIVIPKGTYAVFETPVATHFNFVNTIHETWNYINNIWSPKSGYKRIVGPKFETYVENSHTFREKIYIPIEINIC